MLPSRTARYAMFGLLYFAEGAIMSYFTALNSLYLLSYKLTMSQVGLVGAIALIPFVLKIFLGMLSDRVNLLGHGHRKPYILIGLVLQAVCLVIVPLINPAQWFGLYAALAFVLMTGMALYDTCTDGLALDTTPPEEEGTIQGFMVGGRALGVVLISAVIGTLVDRAGWAAAFYTLAVLTLLPIPLVLMAREGQRPADRKFEWKAFRAFTKRSVITLGVLGALYSLITSGAQQNLTPFLQSEFGISLSAAGLYTTVWGVGMIIGSLAGGRFVDRIGQRRSVLAALMVALGAILALSFTTSASLAWVFTLLFGCAFGYYDTVYFAVSMRATDPRIAASMFAILMAVANLGSGIGLPLCGALADALGYRVAFMLIAALNLLALPLLPLIFPAAAKAEPAVS